MTGMFAPSLEYYDCYQERSTTVKIIRATRSPWPFNEKTEFEYEFAGEYDDGFYSRWQLILYIAKLTHKFESRCPRANSILTGWHVKVNGTD